MNLKLISVLAAGVLSVAPTFASALTLDFEGVSSFQSIDGYYNGGKDTGGASGANVGVSFGLDALGLSNDVLGPYFSNAPTPGSVMAPVGQHSELNYASGFAGQTSFFYSASADTSVSVYSGLNGTGTLLGTIALQANAQNGGCSDSAYCYWNLVTLPFAGIAHSIQFGDAANVAGFDNVSLAPVPLPAAAWLMLSAMGGVGAWARRKRAS